MGNNTWDWASSFSDSDNRQTTYYCLGWSVDDAQPSGRAGIESIPREGQRNLASKLRLELNEFGDWANFVRTVKTDKGLEIYVSIERIWLHWMDWSWRKNSSESNELTCAFSSHIGDKMNGKLLNKLRSKSLTLDDLSEKGRKSLADEVKLPLSEINDWCKLKKIEETTDSFIIFVDIPNAWYNSTRTDNWDWSEDGYNEDKSLRYFICKGTAVSKKVMDAVNATKYDAWNLIPFSAWDALGKKVSLDPTEVLLWGKEFNYTTPPTGLKVRIAVPNIWICANLLQGGNLHWDQLVVNNGGIIGEVVSALGTWTQRTVSCKSVKEIKESFQTYQGKIWGMVLYAHSSPLGYITTSEDKGHINNSLHQGELISSVSAQGYKLAKLYLMQCYSGYKGPIPHFFYNKLDEYIAYVQKYEKVDFSNMRQRERVEFYQKRMIEYWESIFKDCSDYSSNVYIVGDDLVICVYVNWEADWSRHVVGGNLTFYRGVNALGIDNNFFIDYFVEIFKKYIIKSAVKTWKRLF